MPRTLAFLMILALLAACGGGKSVPAAEPAATQPAAQPAQAEPMPAQEAATGAHPRLWLSAADLPRLRSWATDEGGVLMIGP